MSQFFWRFYQTMKPPITANFFGLCSELFRHPRQSLISIFVVFSVLWTLIEAITYFLPDIKGEGGFVLIGMIGLSAFLGLTCLWKPSKIVIKIAMTNTKIEVLFGDLFRREGLRGIGVTDFFENELGVPVSEKSLHGMFIKKYFRNRINDLDAQLGEQLEELDSKNVNKVNGKTRSYPIGTTARIEVGGDKYILFVISTADSNTCKASSDVTKIWVAMRGLWGRARAEAGGDSLVIPLIGNGLSGMGIPPRDLLNVIILSAITETKSKQIAEKIIIVLHPDCFEDINLRDIKKHWKES